MNLFADWFQIGLQDTEDSESATPGAPHGFPSRIIVVDALRRYHLIPETGKFSCGQFFESAGACDPVQCDAAQVDTLLTTLGQCMLQSRKDGSNHLQSGGQFV
ncbi:MAG: uncharacterized protein KVP18_000259 [Porospora cf. gigantea A]|uniref:uncharacterized protein n=1 Tax=Porospora cf. gigantea A TaxID=2853593 RepID=UPI00355A9A94|nr:MAG: hypothetical protein KVP18_000259 [Porospora cf. gigantea A]